MSFPSFVKIYLFAYFGNGLINVCGCSGERRRPERKEVRNDFVSGKRPILVTSLDADWMISEMIINYDYDYDYDIERMINDDEKFADEDSKLKSKVEARNELESFTYR